MKGRCLSGLAAAAVVASLLAVGAHGAQDNTKGQRSTAIGRGAAGAYADERHRDTGSDERRLGRYSGRSGYYGSRYQNNSNNGYWNPNSRYSSDRHRRRHYSSNRSRTAGYRSRYDSNNYPPGWSHGRKRGWRGHSVPPGHWRRD